MTPFAGRSSNTLSFAAPSFNLRNSSFTELISISSAGSVRLFDATASTNTTTGALVIDGGVGIAGMVNAAVLATPTRTPSSSTDTGTAGTITWDASYVYVCTATNTWKRAALSTW